MTTAHATDFEHLARLLVAAAARVEGAEQAPESAEEGPTASPADPSAGTHRLEDLPKELGVLLASVGVLGFVLPGVAGTPALIAGGLVLWPRTFGKVEGWFSRRFPAAHRKSMQQVGRFLDDLERRYPHSDELPQP